MCFELLGVLHGVVLFGVVPVTILWQLMEVEVVCAPLGTDVLELTFSFPCLGLVTRVVLVVHHAALIELLGIQFTRWLF